MRGIIRIWKEKDKIFEGIQNRIFKKADVEHIAAERMEICSTCPHIDKTGESCMVPGTQPCCALCGCSLSLKTRALSAACDDKRWLPVLSQEEQELLDMQLNSDSDEDIIRSDDTHLPK